MRDPPQTNFDSVHLTYFDDNIIGLQNALNEQAWRPAFSTAKNGEASSETNLSNFSTRMQKK
jgi:hypothetical protein